MFDLHELEPLIEQLKQRCDIKANPILYTELSKIEKYGDDSKEKAFMLGRFLDKHARIISIETKELIAEEIKKGKLEIYHSVKYKADKSDSAVFMGIVYLLTIGGVFAIAAGIHQLYHGYFWYGLGTKYNVPIVREGGYKVILGLLMVIGGLIRINYQLKKKRFQRSLLN